MGIACKTCICYAICLNKDVVKCKTIYKEYKILNHNRYGVNVDLMFIYATALGHTDWTVSKTSQELWIWSDGSEVRPKPYIPDEIVPGRDY